MKGKIDLNRLAGVHVLALGDIMLDRYNYGSVERISPEAPVPIFRPIREKNMLGGVGNVAANLASLGCEVNLVSRIGNDREGKLIASMASSIGVNARLLHQKGVATIVKTRLIAGNNHLLRIDSETFSEIDAINADLVLDTVVDLIDDADIVLLSDYAKGFLTSRLCAAVITECKRHDKRVVVDPKGNNYEKYCGSFLVKPNLRELSQVTGRMFLSSSASFIDDVAESARLLARQIGVDGVLVTLSEHGMLYAPSASSKKSLQMPTKAKEVFDVSGAGDTVLAALGAALGAGFDVYQSMQIANVASSVVVSKLGTATASLNEVGMALSASSTCAEESKLVAADNISKVVRRLRKDGKTVGFTNGCFDCCHLGHLRSLQEAKAKCDVLIVGVNSDDWIRDHKGPERPIQDQKTRVALLTSLSCVDYVVVFSDETALPLVKMIRPDVIAKEGYALKDWPEGRYVRSIGGKAISLRRIAGYSTSEIANKMKCR